MLSRFDNVLMKVEKTLMKNGSDKSQTPKIEINNYFKPQALRA